MPLSGDTDQIVDVEIPSDAEVAPEHRASFQYRHMTVLQTRRRAEMLRAAVDEQDEAKCEALLNEVLAFRLAGWKNVRDPDGKEVPSDPANVPALDAALTPSEKWSLAGAAGRAVRLASPKKRLPSGSPANTDTASSAPTAAPSAADA